MDMGVVPGAVGTIECATHGLDADDPARSMQLDIDRIKLLAAYTSPDCAVVYRVCHAPAVASHSCGQILLRVARPFDLDHQS